MTTTYGQYDRVTWPLGLRRSWRISLGESGKFGDGRYDGSSPMTACLSQ